MRNMRRKGRRASTLLASVLKNAKHAGPVAVSIVFVAAGLYFLAASQAAVAVVSVQPETGTVTAPAIKTVDATASGGSAIKFTAAATSSDCVVTAKLVNPCRRWLSGFSNYHVTAAGAGFKTEILDHEQRIGRQLDVVHGYHGPGSFTLSADDKYFINRPKTYLYTTFKPATKWADAGGGNATVNANIDQMANSVKSVAPKKIMLGVFHEPENDVSPGTANCQGLKGNAGSPAEYRAMWANTRKRFDALGVTNVVWVVNYMGTPKWNCMYKDLWPGNNLVDWVMWDPYNFGSETLRWDDRTDDFYGWMTANSSATHAYTSKPWGLAEWGTSETTQKTAYRWYDEAKAAVEANAFPNLKLYAVFDSGDSKTPSDQRVDRDTNHVMDPVEQQHYNAFANSRAFKD